MLINQSYSIVGHQIEHVNHPAPAPLPTHLVYVFDVSGSMTWSLPDMREHLKASIRTLGKPGDIVTIVWFSGRGQTGFLVKRAALQNLSTLQNLDAAIDQWLRPIGLTGFNEPLQLVLKELSQYNDAFTTQFVFMSDGQDNVSNRADVIKTAEALAARVDSAVIIEYTTNADRNMLTQMSEKLKGTLMFSEDIHDLKQVIDLTLQNKVLKIPAVPVHFLNPVGGICFGFRGENLVTIPVDASGVAEVPGDMEQVWAIVSGSDNKHCYDAVTGAYAALSIYATRNQPDLMRAILRSLGDVALIDQFWNCFNKLEYSAFSAEALACALSPASRCHKGQNPNYMPHDDAYSILDLLKDLGPDDLICLDHGMFTYKRTGRKSVSKSPLKFIPDPVPGYPASDLVFHEKRANVSIRVKQYGYVQLPTEAPAPLSGLKFNTFIYRNYTIVNNGIPNIDNLPLRLTIDTFDKIQAACIEGRLSPDAWDQDGPVTIFNLRRMPFMSQANLSAVDPAALLLLEYKLLQCQAAAKIYKHFRDELFPRQSEGFLKVYGPEATEWLKSQGITDYNGFNPDSESVKTEDFYTVKEIDVLIRGFSSLPKVEEVLSGAKSTPPAQMMKRFADSIKAAIDTANSVLDDGSGRVAKAVIENRINSVTTAARDYQAQLGAMKTALIVGNRWLWPDITKEEEDFTIDGVALHATVKAKEAKVYL